MSALTKSASETVCYEVIYQRYNLSQRPRTESATSAVLIGICLGVIYAMCSRFTLLSWDVQWLVLVFLFTFAWNLKDSAFCFLVVQDEVLLRFCARVGFEVAPLFEAGSCQRKFRQWFFVSVFFIELLLLAYVASAVADHYFPIERFRKVPYTGGG